MHWAIHEYQKLWVPRNRALLSPSLRTGIFTVECACPEPFRALALGVVFHISHALRWLHRNPPNPPLPKHEGWKFFLPSLIPFPFRSSNMMPSINYEKLRDLEDSDSERLLSNEPQQPFFSRHSTLASSTFKIVLLL